MSPLARLLAVKIAQERLSAHDAINLLRGEFDRGNLSRSDFLALMNIDFGIYTPATAEERMLAIVERRAAPRRARPRSRPAMTKPWEETWRINSTYPSDVFGSDGGDVLFEGCPDEETISHGRAKLAAAAPEMARLLLELVEREKSRLSDDAREVLTKAGVIPS